MSVHCHLPLLPGKFLTSIWVASFSPPRASVNSLSVAKTSLTVSIVVMSESLGIGCHFFLSSASTAETACCCSQNRSTMSKVEPQRAGSSWISLCCGSFKEACFSFSILVISLDLEKAEMVFRSWDRELATQSIAMAFLTAKSRLWPKLGIQLKSSANALWLLEALSVVIPNILVISNPHDSVTISSRASFRLLAVWSEHPRHQDSISHFPKNAFTASCKDHRLCLVIYLGNFIIHEKNSLTGGHTFFSKLCTRFLNPAFSTEYTGTWSIHIYSATVLLSFLSLLSFGYFICCWKTSWTVGCFWVGSVTLSEPGALDFCNWEREEVQYFN